MKEYPKYRNGRDKKHIVVWAILTLIFICIINDYIGMWSLLFSPAFVIGAYITSRGYLSNEEYKKRFNVLD